MEELNLLSLIERFVAVKEVADRVPKTLKNNRNALKRFHFWLSDQKLSPDVVFNYTVYLKKEKHYLRNSLIHEIEILRQFDKFLLKNKYTLESFMTLIVTPQKQKLRDFVYVDPVRVEDAILLGTEPQPFIRRVSGDNSINKHRKLETRRALRFARRTGLRIGEILRLKGTDLNFLATRPEFHIAPSKGHIDDSAEIPPDMIEELRPFQDKERLFETTEKLCNKSLKRGFKEAGINSRVTNHILRHFFVTRLLKNKVPMPIVQKAARHNSIKVTIDTYGHLDRSDVDPIVQATDPYMRSARTFEEKMEELQRMIKGLHFEVDKDLETPEIISNGSEFSLRMKPKQVL
jgi:integrase